MGNHKTVIKSMHTYIYQQIQRYILRYTPRRVGLVVSVSDSHAVGREFAPRPGHIKYHHNSGTKYLPAWYACVRVGV